MPPHFVFVLVFIHSGLTQSLHAVMSPKKKSVARSSPVKKAPSNGPGSVKPLRSSRPKYVDVLVLVHVV